MVKTPKLYFYDTGLASFLLGLHDKKDIVNYHSRGSLFENFVIAKLLKQNFNKGLYHQFSFWRDKTGNEVDLIIEQGNRKTLIEIKAADTFHAGMLRGIEYCNSLPTEKGTGALIYNGDIEFKTKEKTSVLNWRNIPALI